MDGQGNAMAGHLLRAAINGTPPPPQPGTSITGARPALRTPPLPTEISFPCFSHHCVFGRPGPPPLQLSSGSPGAQETTLLSDEDQKSRQPLGVMTHTHPTN